MSPEQFHELLSEHIPTELKGFYVWLKGFEYMYKDVNLDEMIKDYMKFRDKHWEE